MKKKLVTYLLISALAVTVFAGCGKKDDGGDAAAADPIDGSPPGSPVPGILQARTLEWVAISFPNA